MDKNCLNYGIEISDSDWEGTPASVRQLVEKMGQHIKQSDQELADLKAQQQELLEKINRTSSNSSSHASSDPPSAQKVPEKKKTGRKRGGQAGHKGHSRFLYEPSDCEEVFNHRPETCRCCTEKLSPEDIDPYRHQIVEIPPIKAIVIEHRLHQLVCGSCGSRLFVTVEGVEPTNNSAERAIRPAVIWRRTSFGSQTQAGSTFVARMLTVVTTLKSQRRNVLEFMTRSVDAARKNKPAPSLLPEVIASNKQVIKVA